MAVVDEIFLEQLVQRLRDGNNSVSEDIIIHFLGLTKSLSRHATAQHPHKADDIRSVAVYGLVRAVRFAPKKLYNNNIGPYITTAVRNTIREFLQKDHMIRIPKDAWYAMIDALKLDELDDFEGARALKELKRINLVFQASIPDGIGGFLEDFVKPEWTHKFNNRQEAAICCLDSDLLIVQDIRRYLKLNSFEKQILKMRLQRYTLQEIGEMLQRSAVTIHKTLRKLQERYRTIQRAHPTLPEPPDGI